MRNIWTVFKTDLRTLSKCFFACVVVVAIALLPSLYAWLNIYSNWDPYGNTGGISIAVASLDRGYTDNGEYVNKGRDVLEDLKTATSINWVIVDTEQEATDGVYAGDYYAAVVIDEDFSRKMYRMFTDWTGQPAITYYENAKKNAVATKITDTAVETLKRSISENYLEVVISGIMEQSNLLAADLTETDPETAVKGLLYQAQDVLSGCRAMMDAFRAAGSTGVSETDAQALSDAIASINSSLPDGDAIADSAARLQHALYTALANVERALDRFESALDTAQPPAAQQQLRDAAAAMGKLSTQLSGLAGQLDGINVTGNPVLTAQAIQLRELAGHCTQLQNALNQLADGGAAGGLLADCGALVEAIRNAAARIPVTDRDLRRQLDTVVSEVSDAMDGVKSLSADAKAMRAALSDTTAALSVTMEQLRPAAERMVNALSDTIDPGAPFERSAGDIGAAGRQVDNFNNKQEQAERGAKKVKSVWSSLGGVIKSAIAAFSVKQVIELADSMTTTRARLDLMNDGLQTTAELQDIFIVIGASIVLLALVKSIPDTCAGIINGSHVSGGAAITAATAAVGGAVAGAVGGSIAAGRSAAVTTQNVKDASNIAGMEGKSGMGKGVSVARSMWGARQDAKTAGEKALATRSRSEMKERLERARMATESDNS